ncbi:MAG: DUF2330 domain-containing protein [Proteobacteria bacterium]|nr:DUF2330 domain-containing protein [Pseudomonadota bacterium]
MRPITSCLVALALATAPVLVPSTAAACGGLFCDTLPVAQNAERILFELHGDGTVTTTVEIRYTGEPEGFSWVVPVPETPDLGVVPTSSLAVLDTGTVPQVIPPEVICTEASGTRGALQGANESVDFASDADGEVNVEDLPTVGAFEPEVVSSDDPEALINWLNDNGYLITEEMEPQVAAYVQQGMKFLALKLTPGAGVADIAPLQMTYESDDPTIPIVLTAVGADPEMGVLVFIAGNERYESSNYANLEVDVEHVQWHPATGENNYYPLISWMIDNAGGKAMITEYAGTSTETWNLVNAQTLAVNDFNESLTFINGVLSRNGYMTRAYTRVSAEDMDEDPAFVVSNEGDKSRVLDLSTRPAVEICAIGPSETLDVPCGDMYCGEGALCATTELGIDGCVCGEGTYARSIIAPTGPGGFLAPTVVCQSAEFDMLTSARDNGDLAADACADTTCGDNGTCQDVGGFPTCACEDGYAAASVGGSLECSAIERTYGPEQLMWNAAGCGGCSTGGGAGAGGAALALILLPILGMRRRSSRL